jgi:broad specificity phosphatase PhoE
MRRGAEPLRLYLLRHGEVSSHRGDVPITSDAERHAFDVGRQLGRRERGPILVLSGETRRTIDTAAHLSGGIADVGGQVLGPRIAFALRNPDLYFAGTRVNMVSSAEALAAQVDGVSAEDVASHDFFPKFFASQDRIGWWLTHDSPPGEDAAALVARVRSFASSLTDPIPGSPKSAVAVTHSPLVRAVGIDQWGRDIGEPRWVSGLAMEVGADGTMTAKPFDAEPG